LNGSKVATSGTALTFDGTNFGTTGNANLGSGSKSTDTQLNFASDLGTQRIYLDRGTRSLVFYDATTAIENYRIAGITGVQTWGVGGTEAMRLTSTSLYTASGINVGIGTSSPTFSAGGGLHISNATAANLRLQDTTTNVYTNIWQADNGSTSSFLIDVDPNNVGSGGCPLVINTAGSMKVTLSSSGNLGLGVTPSAWGSAVKAYQVGNSSLVGTSTQMLLSQNYFFDGSDKYITTGPVSQYYQVSGTHQWRIAPSGTAGDTISFTQAMTLTASGNLLVGTTSDQSRRVQVSGTLALVDSGLNSIADMSINSSGVLTISPYNGSGSTIVFGTAASGGGVTERARITSGGNLLVGTTTDEGGRGHFTSGSATNAGVVVTGAANTQGKVQFSSLNKNYYIGGGQDYLGMEYTVDGGQNHLWKIGTTERARITSTGLVGIGISTPASNGGTGAGLVHINGAAADAWAINHYTNGTSGAAAADGLIVGIIGSDMDAYVYNYENSNMRFATNNSERVRITSGGLFLVNIDTSTSYGDGHRIYRNVSEGGFILSVDGGGEYAALFQDVTSGGYSTAAAGIWVGKNSSNSRSINAGGTVNASGADYAEYMEKAGEFFIAKGDVCGIDANGKLTNVYANAVAFVVKSTNPSYVGGDSWGAGYKDDPEGLEAARQKVDRIAFSGQVPVNVLGAMPGQYIVPGNDNGAIKGVAVSNPSFEQYQTAVGKVIAIEDDGRARIIVKIA
jgi:hypothetical protein